MAKAATKEGPGPSLYNCWPPSSEPPPCSLFNQQWLAPVRIALKGCYEMAFGRKRFPTPVVSYVITHTKFENDSCCWGTPVFTTPPVPFHLNRNWQLDCVVSQKDCFVTEQKVILINYYTSYSTRKLIITNPHQKLRKVGERLFSMIQNHKQRQKEKDP